MRSLALLAITILMSVSAFATPGTCFYGRGIDSWQATGPDTLVIRNGGVVYSIRVAFCGSLRWADRVVFRPWTGPWVCQNDDMMTVDWTGRVLDRCSIVDITQVR